MPDVQGARRLEQAIISAIRLGGPLTFARFMDMALYEPGAGYYTSGRQTWGPDGDYITSVDVSPYFASTLARQLSEMWEALGRPERFDLVEAGAGRGWLSGGVIEAMGAICPDLDRALAVTLVDKGPHARQGPLARALWRSDLASVGRVEHGCLLSNELIDSFPAHRVEFSEGSLRELYVGHDGASFFEEAGPLSDPRLASYFQEAGVEPFEGMRTEVNLAAAEWMGEAARVVVRGFVVTIDYGLPAAELYAPERMGSLLCHHRHALNDNPFANIGEQDITTHVDFTTLAASGERAGLELAGFTTQKNFLLGLGILDCLREPEAGSDGAEEMAHNRTIARLISPGGMGDTFKVLVQRKGVAARPLRGFSFKDMSRSLGMGKALF